ncbi:PREDICTED: inositol 1,4,5-trisphosphate receptor-interacting protein-like 1 [Calidris pugnax]|uniref:inositol 1,4,5-trisphosphate receptor-interacting protein-like 1 n=1 Tax=Calidris pugnax TaxID=198806 RepID=UPI00071CF8EE|nr:PREDICTED: inositol 1,4,5-trisphosphate receptor-interacting protein-like 1 [Calidris pugnax]
MAATGLLLFQALQSFFQQVLAAQLDEAMPERMEQRETSLRERATELLQGLEQAAAAWAAPLLPALRQWHFGAIAVLLLLLLLLGLGCWLWKRRCQTGNSGTERTTTKKAEREESEGTARVAMHGRRISAQRLLDLSESFTMVEELVDELLRICRKLSRNSFMPEPRPVVGVSSALGGWSGCEDDAVYRLLVPLKPPRGHAFHVDVGTSSSKGTAERKASLRVELRCTCMREQLAEDMLCFLHHPQKELKERQAPSLLGTLCTGPYLDTDKTSRWLQILLKRAWAVMPQSAHCRLTVLPSRHSCTLRLTNASGSTVRIEMLFGVKEGDSYVFLS